MRKIRILITGAGSGVGQSIAKSLKITKLNIKIIFADINLLNSGLYRFKNSIIVPKVENRGSLNWYIKTLKKLKIDILMIGSEYDLMFFSKHAELIKQKTKCLICVSNPKTVKMFNDKYLTQKFLAENNLPFLKTYLPRNIREAAKISKKIKFPLILKGRHGTSSRNVYQIKNLKELKNNFGFVKNPIIQEHIGSIKNDFGTEFTCSFFKTKQKRIIGPIILKRKILNGTSWFTETVKNKKISALISKIGKLIDCTGSFNIQLRLSKRGPIPFEFNPRFSGTTSIKSYFGYNEPEMFIKSYYLNLILKKNSKKISNGICFRYIDEIFLDNTKETNLKRKIGLGKKIKWF